MLINDDFDGTDVGECCDCHDCRSIVKTTKTKIRDVNHYQLTVVKSAHVVIVMTADP